jgi:hypothetical protein
MPKEPCDPFDDIDRLRISPDEQAAKFAQDQERALRATKSGRKPKGPEFVKFPLSWGPRLKDVSADAVRLSIWLLHRAFRVHKLTFPVPNKAPNGGPWLDCWGIRDRWAKKRALEELELVGLLVLEKRSGKEPVVTLRIDGQ